MAVHQEIDSFITKFKHLMFNGFKASLNIETEDGEAFVVLKAGLGCIKNPSNCPPSNYVGSNKSRSPAYYRRQERRWKDRLNNSVKIETTVPTESVVEKDATEENHAEKACNNKVEVAAASEAVIKHEKAEKASKDPLSCITCRLSFKDQNGLKVHQAKYLGKPHMSNGNGDILIGTERDSTLKYWKTGKMISVYQTYLDVIQEIESSRLSEEEKEVEKENALEARKTALGSTYLKFPPWRKY